MKKILFSILVSIISICTLYAVTIEGYGTGSTEREARIAAQYDLGTRLRTSTSVAVSDQVLANNFGVAHESFSAQTLETFSVELINPQWNYVRRDGAGYEARCYIDSSQVALYVDQYNSAVETINHIYSTLDTRTGLVKDAAYQDLIEALEQYDVYRIIIRILAPDQELTRPVVTSARAIENDYLAFIATETNSSRVAVEAYSATGSDFLSEADKSEYAAQIQNLEYYSTKRAEIIENEMEAVRDANMDNIQGIREAMQSRFEDIDQSSFEEADKSSISYYVNQVESNKMRFSMYKDNLEDALSKLTSAYDAEVRDLEEMLEASISDSELDASGRLRPEFEQRRNELLAQETEVIRERYVDEATKMYLDGVEKLEEITEETEDIINEMNKKDFKLNSDSSSVIFSISSFDLNTLTFEGKAYVIVGSTSWGIDISIPYEDLTGQEFNDSDVFAYSTQMELIDQYIDLLTSVPGFITLEAEFTVEGSISAREYAVNIEGYTIKENAKGRIISKNNKTQGTEITISPVILEDYSVVNKSLIDPGEYRDYVYRYDEVTIEDDGAGTQAVLGLHRDNSYEDMIEGSIPLMFPFGVFAGVNNWGLDLGLKFIVPWNIADLYLFISATAMVDMAFNWQDMGRNGQYSLDGNLMIEKTLANPDWLKTIGFGPSVRWDWKTNEITLGLRLELSSGTSAIGMSWNTAPIGSEDPWKSLDFRVDFRFSLPLAIF